MPLLHLLRLLNSVNNVRVYSLELDHPRPLALPISHCLSLTFHFPFPFPFHLLLAALHQCLLAGVLFLHDTCLFGEEGHDGFEEEDGEGVEMEALVSLQGVLLEVAGEGRPAVGALLGGGVVLLQVGDLVLLGLPFRPVLGSVGGEKGFEFVLELGEVVLEEGSVGGVLEDGEELVDLDLGMVAGPQVEQLLYLRNQLPLQLEVAQLVEGHILLAGHQVHHAEHLLEHFELLLPSLPPQPHVELLLPEVEQHRLVPSHLEAAGVDPRNHLGRVGTQRERLLVEVGEEAVENLQEVVGVEACVVEHGGGEGALRPVGELVGLIGGDAAVVVEEVGVGVAGEAEDAGGAVGVEEVEDVEIEVALQPLRVHVRPVHHLDDAPVLQHSPQLPHLPPQREHIDDVVVVPRRELQQASQPLVALVGVLHVHRNCRLLAQLPDHLLQLQGRRHVGVRLRDFPRPHHLQLCPHELQVLLVGVHVEGCRLDERVEVLRPLPLHLPALPLPSLPIPVSLLVPLDRGFNVVGDGFEDVGAVVRDGGKRGFGDAHKLAEKGDGAPDSIFELVLLVLESSLLLLGQGLGLIEELVAILDYGSGE